MFDEVDEGTAIYKIAPNQDCVPAIPPGVDRYWLTLDADGYKLPSDWYLRVTREIGRMFKGTIASTPTMSLDPGKP